MKVFLFSLNLLFLKLLMPNGGPFHLASMFIHPVRKLSRLNGRTLRRIVSVFVLIHFLSSDFVLAELPTKTFQVIQPEPFSPRSLVGVEIPPLLGILTDRYTGSSGKMVIHLQDSHAHFEAQRNISKLMNFFFQKFPQGIPHLVLLEGAEGGVDTSPLAAIGDSQIREKISTYFLKQGLITGAEYYSIMSPRDVLLLGVDDRKLYLENLEYFQRCQRQEAELGEEIQGVRDFLEKVEEAVFSTPLLELNRVRKNYEKGAAVLGEYCALLKGYWKETGRLEILYPNFSRIVRITESERGIRYDRLNQEMASLISLLQKSLKKEELEKLVEKSLLFRLGKVEQNEYFRLVYTLASGTQTDFQAFPNLSSFFEAIAERNELDSGRVLKELDEVDRRIRSSLYSTEDEKALDQLDRYLSVLDRLVHLTLSKDEFEFYLREKVRYPVEKLDGLLKELAQKFNRPDPAGLVSGKVSQALGELEGFYQTALKRDEAIFLNVLKTMEQEASSVSILITGGFHTSGLTEEFRKRNVSYMVVAPKVSTLPDRSVYLSVMMDLASPLDRELRALGQRLAAPITFAEKPFRSKVALNAVIAKAKLFKAFLERIYRSKGQSLIIEFMLYVNGLADLTRPDGSPRFTREQLKEKVRRLKFVAKQVKVDWKGLVSVGNSFYVPIKVGRKVVRVVRVDQGRSVRLEDIEAEEFGQIDEDVTFYVLPRVYVKPYLALAASKKISAKRLEGLLKGLGTEEIRALSQIFEKVAVTGVKKVERPLSDQFLAFQNEGTLHQDWPKRVIEHGYFLPDEIRAKVERVEIIEALLASTVRPSRLETRYDLLHATAVAARHALRWASDTGNSFIGKRADEEGARWLRAFFNFLDWFKGKVVTGEGAGEVLGRGTQQVDMAVGAASVVAYAGKGGLRSLPDVYMRKFLVSPEAKGAGVDVTKPVASNLEKLSQKLRRPVSQLRGAVLLRPYHKKLIRDLLMAGIAIDQPIDARSDEQFEAFWGRVNAQIERTGFLQLGHLTLMGDGDLMGAWGLASGKIDFVLGTGEVSQAVISAAITESIGGEMSAQLSSREALQKSSDADPDEDFESYTPEEIAKLARFKIVNPGTERKGQVPWNKVWRSSELAPGKDVLVVASAIKDSPWIDSLKGPEVNPETGEATVYSVVASKTGRVRVVRTSYDLGIKAIQSEINPMEGPAASPEIKVDLYLEWAETLANHGFYRKVIPLLERSEGDVAGASNRDKIGAALSFYQAMSLLLAGTTNFNLVREFLEGAIKLDPEERLGARKLLVEVYRRLAEEAERIENVAGARDHYTRAIEIASLPGFEAALDELRGKLAALPALEVPAVAAPPVAAPAPAAPELDEIDWAARLSDSERAAPAEPGVKAAAAGLVRALEGAPRAGEATPVAALPAVVAEGPPAAVAPEPVRAAVPPELKDLAGLNELWNKADRQPAALILGGSGDLGKIQWLKRLLEGGKLKEGDAIFLGGDMVFPFLMYREFQIGSSPLAPEAYDLVKEILDRAEDVRSDGYYLLPSGVKIYYPLDMIYESLDRRLDEGASVSAPLAGPMLPPSKRWVDIGRATRGHYSENLRDYEMFVAVGGMGLYSFQDGMVQGYADGTRAVLATLHNAYGAKEDSRVILIGEDLVGVANEVGRRETLFSFGIPQVDLALRVLEGVPVSELGQKVVPEIEGSLVEKLLALDSVWNQEDRPPVALVIGGSGDLDRLQWLKRLMDEGKIREGDAVFLGGELAYPFLADLKGENVISIGLPLAEGAMELVREMVEDAKAVSFDHHFYVLRNGVEIYLPMDFRFRVFEGQVSQARTGPGIPSDAFDVGIGEETIRRYSGELRLSDGQRRYGVILAMGLLGSDPDQLSSEIILNNALVEAQENGDAKVFLIGKDLVELAGSLGISDRRDAQSPVSAMIPDERFVEPILRGRRLAGDIVLARVEAILKNPQADLTSLETILDSLDHSPILLVQSFDMVANHILHVLLESIESFQKLGAQQLFQQVFHAIFTDEVLKTFSFEGKTRQDIELEDIRRLLSQQAFALLDALLMRGQRGSILQPFREPGRPSFYDYLNQREREMAEVLSKKLLQKWDIVGIWLAYFWGRTDPGTLRQFRDARAAFDHAA